METNIWDKVASDFGKIGPKYWNRFGERLVSISNIKSGARVLDIGTGRGIFEAIEKLGEDVFQKFKRDVFGELEKFKKNDGLYFNMPVIYAFGIK